MFRKTACSILVMALSGCVSNGDNFGSALNKVVDDALAPLDNLAAGLDPNAAQETSMPAQKETWTPTERRCCPNQLDLNGTFGEAHDLITKSLFISASWASRFTLSSTGRSTTVP